MSIDFFGDRTYGIDSNPCYPILDIDEMPNLNEIEEASFALLVESQKYEEALKLLPSNPAINPQMLLAAATCYFKTHNMNKTLELSIVAEKKGWTLPEVYTLKGRCLFKSGEYQSALKAFQTADNIRSTPSTTHWIYRCKARVESERLGSTDSHFFTLHVTPAIPKPVPKTVPHDWYQSNKYVSLSLYEPHVNPHHLYILFGLTSVTIEIRSSTDPVEMYFQLAKEIIPEDCTWEITPSKVEIKMKKAQEVKWSQIEIKPKK